MNPKKSSLSSLPAAPISVAHDVIAERAQAIWRERGSPAGQDLEHWLEAERQLGLRHGSQVRDPMERVSADFSPDEENVLKDEVDKEIDEMDRPAAQRSATSL
jgi:Protein of unknown function (DUF2934)